MKTFHRRVLLFLILILSAAALFSATPSAQSVAGHLDGTFGTGGVVTTDILALDNHAYAVAIQPDGKICVAGRAGGLDAAFGVVRYLKDGQLDATFGDGGKVLTGINFSSTPTTLALTADGKLLVGGYYLHIVDELVYGLVRLNADGSPDATFASTGMVGTQFGGSSARYAAATATTDGKYLLAGSVNRGPSATADDFALARFNSNGSLDVSFGVGGMVVKDVGVNDRVRDLLTQPDGKILLAGYSGVQAATAPLPSEARLALLRFNADGSEDSGFNAKPVIDDVSRPTLANALAMQADGRIVVAGSSGSKVRVKILVSRVGGFTGELSIGQPELPLKVVITAVEPFIDGGTFILKIKGKAKPGTYPLVFEVSDAAGRKRSATVTLIIT
ncbi:MAG TPA: hypothetical protein VKA60_15350 [Blastocatellia bacterium]|nr:hypothetical protein [Blastocatellia bacterium]